MPVGLFGAYAPPRSEDRHWSIASKKTVTKSKDFSTNPSIKIHGLEMAKNMDFGKKLKKTHQLLKTPKKNGEISSRSVFKNRSSRKARNEADSEWLKRGKTPWVVRTIAKT